MDLVEMFNILYLFIGIALVSYFWVVGNAIKKYASFVHIPKVITGFFATMMMWSPFFLFTHITNGVNYKIYFLIYMIISITASLSMLRKSDLKKIKPSSIYIVATLWIGSILYGYMNNAIRGNIHQDYWLYGQWMSDASNFVSSAINIGNSDYFYSVFYRFFGSFIGLFQSIPMIDIDLTLATKTYLPIIQTPLSLVLLVLMFEVFKYAVSKFNYITIGMFMIIAIFTETYQSVLIGSYLLWIISTIAIVDLMKKQNDERVIAILLGTMIYFTSSVLLIAVPLFIIYRLVLKENQKYINMATIFILIKYCIVNYSYGLSMTIYVLPLILMIIYTITYKWYAEAISMLNTVIDKFPVQWILVSAASILVFNFMGHDDNEAGMIVLITVRTIGLVLVTTAAIIFYKKDKSTTFVYMMFVTAMFANPITFVIFENIGDNDFTNIIHRFTQNALLGETASYTSIAIIVPWLLSEFIDTKTT